MSTPIPARGEVLEATHDRGEPGGAAAPRVCVVGASGKLGRYMVQHALDRGYEVVAVCREVSVDKLEEFSGRITIIPGATDDRQVIERSVARCDAVLTVLVPRGVHHYSSGTAQAVLDLPVPGLAWCSRVATTSRVTARTCIRGRLRRWYRWRAGSRDSSESSTSTTRWRRAGGSSPVPRGGPLCAAATWRRGATRPARVEPTRGRPDPQEQPHATRGLRPVHGGGHRE